MIELEDDEKDPEEMKIENDQMDGEINVSDDSDNYIPTPRDDENDSDVYQETENNTERIYNKNNESNGFGYEASPSKDNKEDRLDALNLDEETKDIFKYIKVNI